MSKDLRGNELRASRLLTTSKPYRVVLSTIVSYFFVTIVYFVATIASPESLFEGDGVLSYIARGYAFIFALAAGYFAFLFIAHVVSLVALWKFPSKGASPACRQARVVLADDDQQAVLAQCTKALRKIGATIITIDSKSGVIKAIKKPSRIYFASPLIDDIVVSIQRTKNGCTTISIESDGVQPMGYSSHAHKQNTDRFVDHLLAT